MNNKYCLNYYLKLINNFYTHNFFIENLLKILFILCENKFILLNKYYFTEILFDLFKFYQNKFIKYFIYYYEIN